MNKTSVPPQGLNWKEFKLKKKEGYKNWKEEKLKKKLRKLEEKKSKINSSQLENSLVVKRDFTVSIAVPGNVLDNAQSPELKTYLAGQIARAAAVFNVNEIIVFSETGIPSVVDNEQSLKLHQKNHGCVQLVRILQYLECPQYLRKYYFPLHKDLEYAGLLNPLDLPHHLRVDDDSEFREGIVQNKPVKQGSNSGSYVYIGLQKSAVIDKVLEPNLRVTVQLDKEQTSKKHFKGKAVSPSYPSKYNGIYWGYNVRLANNLNSVFTECPFKGGYDVCVGTSEKGDSVDEFQMPSFKHLLIVFGGLRGLEACIDNDESLPATGPEELFHHYLNTCPSQGSRSIRTEEAILITLAALRPGISSSENTLKNGESSTISQS